MPKVKHSPTHKKRSQSRTIKIKSLLDKVEQGLLCVIEVPGTKKRVLTTLDPNHRSLLRVEIDQADLADDIFTKLMGEVVEPRRDFIVENALNVANLDV